MGCLKIIFTAAIQKAFPQVMYTDNGHGIITRCGNPAFGDFQCNNSLAIAKYFKTFSNFTGEKKLKIRNIYEYMQWIILIIIQMNKLRQYENK